MKRNVVLIVISAFVLFLLSAKVENGTFPPDEKSHSWNAQLHFGDAVLSGDKTIIIKSVTYSNGYVPTRPIVPASFRVEARNPAPPNDGTFAAQFDFNNCGTQTTYLVVPPHKKISLREVNVDHTIDPFVYLSGEVVDD